MSLSEKDKIEFIGEYSKIANSKELQNNPSQSEMREFVNRHRKHFDSVPRKLYKYRRFDKKGYTYDSIIYDRYFLSRADSFDDAFEASLKNGLNESYSDRSFFDQVFLYCLQKVLEEYKIDNIPIEEFYYELKKHSEKGMTLFLDDILKCFDKPTEDDLDVLGALINCVLYLNNYDIIKMIDDWTKRLRDFQSNAGIFSLTTNKMSQIMWEYYANHYKGCCIEYSIDEDDYSNLVDIAPVVYCKERTENALTIVLDYIINEKMYGTERALNILSESVFRLSTVKDPEWEFQDEWRMLGATGYSSHKAPKISAIYLGHNISPKDRKKIIKIANKKQIPLFITWFDYDNTEIRFRELIF